VSFIAGILLRARGAAGGVRPRLPLAPEPQEAMPQSLPGEAACRDPAVPLATSQPLVHSGAAHHHTTRAPAPVAPQSGRELAARVAGPLVAPANPDDPVSVEPLAVAAIAAEEQRRPATRAIPTPPVAEITPGVVAAVDAPGTAEQQVDRAIVPTHETLPAPTVPERSQLRSAVAAARRPSAAVHQPPRTAATPQVEIHIGRVEIVAVAPSPRTRVNASAKAVPRPLSLDAYLASRVKSG